MTKAYAMRKPGGRRGKLCNRESRTPEREERSPTERGASRGPSPWTRSLGTFSGARESASSAGTRPGNPKGLPELSGKRDSAPQRNISYLLSHRSYLKKSGLLVPFGPCQKELALRRNLVVAKSALHRFRPRTAKTALRSLAPPFPTEPASLGFGGGPKPPPGRDPAALALRGSTPRRPQQTGKREWTAT